MSIIFGPILVAVRYKKQYNIICIALLFIIKCSNQYITTIESCRCHIATPATQWQFLAYGIFYIYAIQSYRTALRLSGKFSRGPFIHSPLSPCAKRACFIDADPPQERVEVLAGSRPAGNASRSEHSTAVAR